MSKMTRPIQLGRLADAEFQEAVDWYEQRSPGKGVELALSVRQALNRVANQPDFHPFAFADVREAKVQNFPYCIYYREEDQHVSVIAIVHASRDPAVWQRRV